MLYHDLDLLEFPINNFFSLGKINSHQERKSPLVINLSLCTHSDPSPADSIVAHVQHTIGNSAQICTLWKTVKISVISYIVQYEVLVGRTIPLHTLDDEEVMGYLIPAM